MLRRSPDHVMRLARLGSFYPSRLSFIPQLLRRARLEEWRFTRRYFALDSAGVGTVIYQVDTPDRSYSLIVFSRAITPEQRSDRVIAESWDATFVLFDGVPEDAEIERLEQNAPRQEAGRFLASDLVLSRANKSVRLFSYVRDTLARGVQPEAARLAEVGYLMRTTAVYGSGKFGCADRGKIAGRSEFHVAFQVEMLAVYLFRWFSIDLVEHCARVEGGEEAVGLSESLSRCLGIGNSTGLGMSPFLVNHPQLVHRWIAARERALSRVCALRSARFKAEFLTLFARGREHIAEWQVGDAEQSARIGEVLSELESLATGLPALLDETYPWRCLLEYVAEHYSLETQEFLNSMTLAPHGVLIDDLCEGMGGSAEETLRPEMRIAELRGLIESHYDWALSCDFKAPASQQHFWYYSEEKLEPRFGDRFAESGAEREMPLTVARDVQQMTKALRDFADDDSVASLLLEHPDYRDIVRRVQGITRYPYGEIRDNLIASEVRPLDILRVKLSFFGVMKFDPKSDLWLRVTMYQGAPQPDRLTESCADCPAWSYPVVRDGIPCACHKE